MATTDIKRFSLFAVVGNVTTINFNITLDFTNACNPVIALAWPTNGMEICQSNFTLRGWTEDASATVTAQITDTNGDTNVVGGIVERTGVLWVNNLPLAEGTNTLTLTVTNSAGLSSETNLVVVQSTLNMTMNPVTGNLWLPTTTVSGTISDPGDYTVWVNGVQAVVTGNNWEANNVPLPQGDGVTAVQARAIPNSNNGGNGTGGSAGGPVTFDNLGNPDPAQDNDLESGALTSQTGVVVDSAKWSSDYGDEISEQTLEVEHTEGNYTRARGGTYSIEDESQWTNQETYYTAWTIYDLAPGGGITNETYYDSEGAYANFDPGGTFTFPSEEGTLNFPENQYDYWDRNTEVHLALLTSGLGVVGQSALAVVGTSAAAEQVNGIEGNVSSTSIASQLINIPGLGQNLGADGLASGPVSIGPPADVTPTAGPPAYTFTGPGATEYSSGKCIVSSIVTNCSEAGVSFGTNSVFTCGLPITVSTTLTSYPGLILVDTSYTNANPNCNTNCTCSDTYTSNNPEPVIISETWADSSGGGSGSGLIAVFTPTNQSGTVTFTVVWQHVACDANYATNTTSATYDIPCPTISSRILQNGVIFA